jgi:hypothetical protein
MVDNLNESDRRFYELFSEYMDFLEARDHAVEEADDLYHQLLEMIEQDQVSTIGVIQTFSMMLSKHISRRLTLLQFMCAIVEIQRLKNRYSYPEFFWLILKSNILSESENFEIIVPRMTDIVGVDIMRAYLTFALVTEDESKQRAIIKAFYYTGLTVDTLKVITQHVPPEEDSLDLYVFICSDAMQFLYSERAATLSNGEKIYLRNFFEQGTRLAHPHIIDSCRKALAQLNNLTWEFS